MSQEETPFGQYQLIEKIAQGGMAEIFRGKALDAHGIERPVVIKRILPHIAASPEFVDMLIDEAKIAVMLSHGNIAQIYDLGKVADDYFIVMEYVEGKTLSQIAKRLRTQGKLIPVAYAAYLCLEIANALEYMHRKTDDQGNPLNIVHRDISPQNVILSTAGTVKIIDFGIAKAKTKVSTTDSGVLKGKFAYMSPEHAEGMKLDHRTDIFSLGIMLYELLTGQRLFKGKNNVETIRRVKKSKVPVPSSLRTAVPKALDKIVFKALQRDRDKRYQSAHDLARDLTKFLVTYFSEFSPRELVRYLPEIFPEIAPVEKNRDEETPHVPMEIRKEPRSEEQADEDHATVKEAREDTVAADSEVLRTKLKETEVFEVSGAERPSDDEEDSPIAPEEEHTSRIRLTPLLGVLAGILSLVVLVTAVWWGVRHVRANRKAHEAQEQQISEFTRRQNLLNRLKIEPQARPAPATPTVPDNAPPLSTPPPLPPPPIPPPPPPPQPAAVIDMGALIVDSQPQGAKIFLDDVDSNQKTPHRFTQVPLGPKKVGLFLDRYRFWEGTVEIKPGDGAKIAPALSLNYGDMEINSLPPGASVEINGRVVGKTPFHMGQLEPETVYNVVLRLDGYQDWKGVAKVFGGKNEVINASLKKASRDGALP